jgi:hypothetical protein
VAGVDGSIIQGPPRSELEEAHGGAPFGLGRSCCTGEKNSVMNRARMGKLELTIHGRGNRNSEQGRWARAGELEQGPSAAS